MAQPSKAQARKLRIPGTPSPAQTKSTEVIEIRESRSFTIGARRDEATEGLEIATAPDEVVEIELVDGARFWTTRERLCDEVLRDTAQRGSDGVMTLPASLPVRTPSRGVIGSLAIKALRFFDIDVPKLAAEKIADIFEKRALKKAGELFRCSTQDAFRLTPAGPIPSDRPILLFLHGTASSTEGSFAALWERRAIREELFKNYDGKVFGFEHRTMSESPIENTIELLSKLPKGARLHLVSHSRGGLIGELLCRATMTGGREPFDKDDLSFFKKADGRGARGDLGTLNKLLKTQAPRVERFVRVGCPARGTTLASERFDLFLSVLFNLIEKIPVLQTAIDIFSELIMAIAQERAEPDVLPGLEAMIPDAPLIRLLNRPGISVDGELRVIAGDVEGENLSSVLGTLVTDPLYLGDHDLVVDTAAMFGGAERADGKAKFSFHQGARVSHFRYFANEDSAARLSRAIAVKDTSQDGFNDFHVHDDDSALPAYKRDERQPQPVVFLLPGIMGSHLAVGKDRIWIDPVDLAFGGLSRLKIDAKGVVAEAPVGLAYGDFIKFLSRSHEVVPFPFDWRISLLEEAARLADAIEKKLGETEPRNHPVTIVAHSMGGLLARAMIAQHADTWQRMLKHPQARLIMLGTPNGGSFIVPLVFTARESMVKQLAMVDFTSNEAELLEVLRFYPGLAQMIPALETSMDFFAPATWTALRSADDKKRVWTEPVQSVLDAGRALRNLLDSKKTVFPERMCYVAGQAPATPAALNIVKDDNGAERIVVEASPEGDGRVLWSTGRLPEVKTWYMPALHGDMADHEPAFPALKELIESGDTDKLPKVAPAARGVPARFELREQKTPIYPDADSLIRSALGKKRRLRTKAIAKTRVSVIHGNLAFARHPVMVGHYEGDTIVSAEAQLDRSLEGRLRERLRLGLYPGPVDSEIVVLNPTSQSCGAVVIGLGQVGTLSPGALARAVSRGARAFAVMAAEDKNRPHPKNLQLSVLLIGTGAGGFSIDDSVAAILRGIAGANDLLSAGAEKEHSRIDELELIELYEDRAIAAVRALQRMQADVALAQCFDIDRNLTITARTGRRRRVSFVEDPNWWQRLQIVEDDRSRLAYNLLTDRARTQAYLQPTQRSLIDGFIADAISQTSTDPRVAVTLFEMLVPNELKQRAPDQQNMVLILDEGAARYPWELMQEGRFGSMRNGAAPKPLSVQAGMLRQLQSAIFRENVLTAQSRRALVIGDPPSDFVPLAGAVQEAQSVASMLKNADYEVVPIIRDLDDDPAADDKAPELTKEILKQLFATDYRILHLAGHGVYDYVAEGADAKKTDKISGMVIGENKFLTPAVIHQMRAVPELVFINCCHLGRTEARRVGANFPVLAANLATELIRMGVRAVVAAGWAVDDAAAQQFAEEFYRRFLDGVPFGIAVHEARQAIFAAHPGVNTWGAYQCYGDPAFALTSGESQRGGAKDERRYAAPSEAIVDLENIAEDAASAAPGQRDDYQTFVKQIAASVPPDWLKQSELQAALGRAYGELAMFDQAVEHYELALKNESAQAPIRAAEQVANLMMRQAARLENRTQARAKIGAAKHRIETLIASLGATAERHSLLGGIAKRQALLARTRREKEAHLRAMRDAYKRAIELAGKADQQVDPYPHLNWLTADILLARLGGKADSRQTQNEELLKAEAAALAKNEGQPRFWDAVSVIDAKLLRALADESLPKWSASLSAEYLKVKAEASPREFRSVIEQLEFLLDAISAGRNSAGNNRLIGALETMLGELKN